MKKLVAVIFILFAAGVFAFGKPADYSGNWTLDVKQSKNLPPFYSNIKSHKLSIMQNEKLLNVAVEIAEADGEPRKVNLTYNLDGSEMKSEAIIRTQNGQIKVPTSAKVTVAADGKIRISIVRILPENNSSIFGTTIEDWQLSKDGKTLKIHRTNETPNGTLESEMIFVKS